MSQGTTKGNIAIVPPIDAVPTDGSANPVSSNGVFDALALKQDEFFDFYTKKEFLFFEDFMSNQDAATTTGTIGLTLNAGGAGSRAQQTLTYPTGNVFGVLSMQTGTTTTGSSQVRYGTNNSSTQQFGNGAFIFQTYINIETLSDATDRFWNFFGFQTNALPNPLNAIGFLYDEGNVYSGSTGSSPNFKCLTRSGAVNTYTTTSVPVVASQWYKLQIIINANATSVQFYIDNVLVATHTTNIPTTGTAKILHQKSAGTNNRRCFSDYIMLNQIFTTERV